MTDDIHKWTDGRYTLMFDEHTFFVWDNEKEERMTALQVTKKLNEQRDTINKLREVLAEAEDMIEVRLAAHYIKEYENIKHHIIGDDDG